MSKDITLSLFEIVGSSRCVASDDGQKVHDRIAAALQQGRGVVISFSNVTSLTSAFLNAAIGQLYSSFAAEQIRAKLKVKDIEPDDRALLKRVVDTAKDYFNNTSRFQIATREMLGDADGRPSLPGR